VVGKGILRLGRRLIRGYAPAYFRGIHELRQGCERVGRIEKRGGLLEKKGSVFDGYLKEGRNQTLKGGELQHFWGRVFQKGEKLRTAGKFYFQREFLLKTF